MKQKEQGFGARSLPNRNYISQMVTAVMHQGEGLEFTVTTLWNDLPLSTRDTLVNAYGGSVAAKHAVQRCVQNMHNLHGNPAKIRGRGKKAIYIYNHETDKAGRKDVVFTTETPDPFDDFDDGRAQESDVGGSESVREPFNPFEDKESFVSKAEERRDKVLSDRAMIEAGYREGRVEERTSSDPMIGDTKTYTLVGFFLDGTFLWREFETGHVGSIEFTAL